MQWRPALAVLGGVVVLTSCGHTAKISSTKIQRELVTSITSQRPGLKVVAACPGGMTARVGVKIGCGVTIGNDPVNYTITITGVAGGTYASEATPTLPIIDTQSIIASITPQEPAGAVVSCGHARFVQYAVNTRFECTVAQHGYTDTLAFVVKDDQGDVTLVTPGALHGPTTTTPSTPGSLPGD